MGRQAAGGCREAGGELIYQMCSFLQMINSIKKRRNEIASMHISVPLAMFCLDTMTINYELCERAQNLKDRLIQFQVDRNRDNNTRYPYVCRSVAAAFGTNGRMEKEPELAPENSDRTEHLVEVTYAPA